MRFFNIFSSSFTSTAKWSCPNKLKISSEDIRNFKDTLIAMKGRRMNATAMRLLTNETNYKVTIEVSTKAIRALKKVIRRGVGQYQPGSKTDQLITSFKEVKQEYDEMILKMDIKMVPSKADYVIECWLKKDAAEKAAKESKDRKALKNAARKAEKNAHEESSYFRVDDPEPEPQNIYRIDPIIEIYV
ncbi:uncharacterized protein CELE_B0563.1 [Caenorhabditis elegans]|uniref:Uncharacterized protein B0563.1 n=1 Tax=Caenorhabditis elegans TaxID=6239 RepID=YT61_CAEEL|nr:Uncharacterized protein CELE_B0563.1 [Caenorhabditis elegans]Q11078.1 RecName: Full=Uncharacterized protein B0563.1 [Caenorhabditis elegans]CCD62250.1 Uncharacterized protein CELE_B0563.1 [Caenorhabditis elegans]|eukprot:NP_509547.1 Uncharacterized protein CELE_B0563.1 [Caenorhabditis elegans]